MMIDMCGLQNCVGIGLFGLQSPMWVVVCGHWTMWFIKSCVDYPVWRLACVDCRLLCGSSCVGIDMCGLQCHVWIVLCGH